MKKIGWIKISSRKYGSTLYEEQAKKILDKHFDLEFININSKYFKRGYFRAPETFLNLSKVEGRKDLWIRDIHTVLTMLFDKTDGKNLVIIHDVNFYLVPLLLKPFFYILERFFYYNLKKIDAIVTVSEYWKNHFSAKGYSNIYKIYNSFDLSDFNFGVKEVLEFKKKYNLFKKPIIYIGNCQKKKGVVEVYNTLKNLDVYLVSSGEQFVKIPSINLNLDYKDYLRLLKASSVTITMSKYKEGWCRVAHEAMLCKTPVIGSGQGGMRELLEGGKQVICSDFDSLQEKVEYLLSNPKIRKEIGENGYNFAKNFTIEKFEKEWVDLIKNLTST